MVSSLSSRRSVEQPPRGGWVGSVLLFVKQLYFDILFLLNVHDGYGDNLRDVCHMSSTPKNILILGSHPCLGIDANDENWKPSLTERTMAQIEENFDSKGLTYTSVRLSEKYIEEEDDQVQVTTGNNDSRKCVIALSGARNWKAKQTRTLSKGELFISEQIKSSAYIMLCYPLYWSDPPANMKAVLDVCIDRKVAIGEDSYPSAIWVALLSFLGKFLPRGSGVLRYGSNGLWRDKQVILYESAGGPNAARTRFGLKSTTVEAAFLFCGAWIKKHRILQQVNEPLFGYNKEYRDVALAYWQRCITKDTDKIRHELALL